MNENYNNNEVPFEEDNNTAVSTEVDDSSNIGVKVIIGAGALGAAGFFALKKFLKSKGVRVRFPIYIEKKKETEEKKPEEKVVESTATEVEDKEDFTEA